MTYVSSTSFKVSVLLLLSIGTILFFNLYDRYLIIGPELITDGIFNSNLAEWEHSRHSVSVATPGAGIAHLESNNPADIVELGQTIRGAERYSLLRLACDVKTDNIPRRRGHWNTARVILVSHDQNGIPLWRLPYALTTLDGTRDWEHHEGVFTVETGVVQLRLSAQLAQTTGTMWIRNLSLRPLMEKASFHKFRNAFTLLWAAAVLWIAVPIVWSAYGNVHRITIMVLAFVIAFGALMPEGLKEHLVSSLFPSLMEPSAASSTIVAFKFTPLLPTPDIYKAGHFAMFAILAVVTFSRRLFQISPIQILIYLLLFALVTEILQLLVDGRSAQFGDVLIDGAGIAAGVMLLRIARVFRLAPD